MKIIFYSLLILFASLFSQQTIFHSFPDWESNPQGDVSTGLGIADINGDGWDDIIVANGNDIDRQHVVVYLNNGDGTFPTTPNWSSSDIDYHGHLAVGDINADGFPDVAVSVFLGPGGFSDPGHVKVYMNQGGQLEATPSYQTADNMFNFSCALGDADGDGDLDLAVAGGQPYDIGAGPYQTHGRIYYNINDSLQALPGWISQNLMGAMDVDFADMDNNGFLDVIFACHLTPNYIFLADSQGQISTQESWHSQDNSYFGNSLAIADIDGNTSPDLIVSDNSQLAGAIKNFKGYFFNDAPGGQSNPAWYSQSVEYASAVIAEDVSDDGLADLIGGRWWGPVYLFKGNGSTLSSVADWTSSTNSVAEAFALRDLDQDASFSVSDTISVSRDSIHVLKMSHPAVERILSITLNDQPLLSGADYTSIPGGKWISIEQPLLSGDQVVVNYTASRDRDLVMTNWDSGKGNYLFYNQTDPVSIEAPPAVISEFSLGAYPNPFNRSCHIQVKLPEASDIQLDIFDMTGRLVKRIHKGNLQGGPNTFNWSGVNEKGAVVGSGMYLVRLKAGIQTLSQKILLIK